MMQSTTGANQQKGRKAQPERLGGRRLWWETLEKRLPGRLLSALCFPSIIAALVMRNILIYLRNQSILAVVSVAPSLQKSVTVHAGKVGGDCAELDVISYGLILLSQLLGCEPGVGELESDEALQLIHKHSSAIELWKRSCTPFIVLKDAGR